MRVNIYIYLPELWKMILYVNMLSDYPQFDYRKS